MMSRKWDLLPVASRRPVAAPPVASRRLAAATARSPTKNEREPRPPQQGGQLETKVLRLGSDLKVVSLTLQLQPQTSSLAAAGLSCNLEALGPVHYLPSVAPQQLTISFLGIH